MTWKRPRTPRGTSVGAESAIANKTAALGLNLLLLAHLAWTGWLALGFVRRTGTFHDVERWQTRYLPVYGLWAAIVVVAFPLVFRFD